MSETPGFYETLRDSLTLTIKGQVVPKARPRFKAGQGGFLPKRYRDWKQGAIAELLAQVHGIEGLPLVKAAIDIQIYGNCRGDLDNLAGSILDALVQASILKNDGLLNVPALTLKHHVAASSEAKASILISPIARHTR